MADPRAPFPSGLEHTLAAPAAASPGPDVRPAAGASQRPISGVDETLAAADVLGGVEATRDRPAVEGGRPTDSESAATRATAGELPLVEPGRYAVAGEVARGGLGRILKADDQRLQRPVALKELLRGGGEATARFLREALVTARLQHPSIVPVYDAGRWPSGAPFYAMKLVSGRSLDEVIAQTRTLAERLALLPSVIAVVEAIAYAHSERIIHRDLKPANVLVGAFGETVVVDWGLAKDLTQVAAPEEQPEQASPSDPAAEAPPGTAPSGAQTVAGAVMGTPSYMPPEQATGQFVDERADVYALGALLYHVLAGAAPYTAPSSVAVLAQVLLGPPLALDQRQPGVPRELVTIVAKAMARQPADRYPSARELAEDLRRFHTGQLVAAHQYSRRELLLRWLRRHRAVLGVTAAAVVVLGTSGVVSVRRIVAERDRAERQHIAALRQRALSEKNAQNNMMAELLAARVLAHEERSDMRGIIVEHTNAWRPVLERTWEVGPGGCRAVTLASDGAALCAGSGGLWRLAAAPALPPAHLADGNLAAIVAAALPGTSGDVLIFGGRDGVLQWARGLAEHPLRAAGVLERSADAITVVAVAADQRRFAVGHESGRITLWQLGATSPAPLHGYPPLGKDAVRALAFAPNGELLAAGYDDNTLGLWSTDVTQAPTTPRYRLIGHVDCVTAVSFVADGTRLVSGSDDATLREWPASGGAALAKLTGHLGAVNALVAVPGRSLVASASRDVTVRIWDLDEQRERLRIVGHPGVLRALAIAPDGTRLVSSNDDGHVFAWRLPRAWRATLIGHHEDVTALAFSPDGSVLASASRDHTVRLWSRPFDTSRPLMLADEAWALAFASDGRLGAAGLGPAVTLIDGEAVHHPRGIMPDDITRIRTLAFSPDGRLLALGGGAPGSPSDNRIRVWDTQAARLAFTPLAGHDKFVYAVAFSRDGTRLASGSRDNTARIWDVAHGVALGLPLVHPHWVTSLAFTPDGATLITGCGDGFIYLWDAASGKLRTRLAGHDGWVLAVALSPPGDLLASAGEDRSVRLWDLATRREIARLVDHQDMVWSVAFSPDGKMLASGGRDRRVRLWELRELRTSGPALWARAQRDFGLHLDE